MLTKTTKKTKNKTLAAVCKQSFVLRVQDYYNVKSWQVILSTPNRSCNLNFCSNLLDSEPKTCFSPFHGSSDYIKNKQILTYKFCHFHLSLQNMSISHIQSAWQYEPTEMFNTTCEYTNTLTDTHIYTHTRYPHHIHRTEKYTYPKFLPIRLPLLSTHLPSSSSWGTWKRRKNKNTSTWFHTQAPLYIYRCMQTHKHTHTHRLCIKKSYTYLKTQKHWHVDFQLSFHFFYMKWSIKHTFSPNHYSAFTLLVKKGKKNNKIRFPKTLTYILHTQA